MSKSSNKPMGKMRMEKGVWVFYCGRTMDTDFSNRMIDQVRREREFAILGRRAKR